MKKSESKAMRMLPAILLLCTGCASPTASSAHASSSTSEFTQKYVLTAFYGSEKERNEWIDQKKEEGAQHNLSYDASSGHLTITASLTQAQYWLDQSQNEIEQNAMTIGKDDHFSVSVNASDTEMTITTSEDWNLSHVQETADRDLIAMEIHQVFSGISSWHIDVNIVSENTGTAVKTFSLPDDDFFLNDSIWQS